MYKKVFSGDFQSPEGILTKPTRNIRELSAEKKALCTVRKKAVPIYAAEEREYENEDSVEIADDHAETYLARV